MRAHIDQLIFYPYTGEIARKTTPQEAIEASSNFKFGFHPKHTFSQQLDVVDLYNCYLPRNEKILSFCLPRHRENI